MEIVTICAWCIIVVPWLIEATRDCLHLQNIQVRWRWCTAWANLTKHNKANRYQTIQNILSHFYWVWATYSSPNETTPSATQAWPSPQLLSGVHDNLVKLKQSNKANTSNWNSANKDIVDFFTVLPRKLRLSPHFIRTGFPRLFWKLFLHLHSHPHLQRLTKLQILSSHRSTKSICLTTTTSRALAPTVRYDYQHSLHMIHYWHEFRATTTALGTTVPAPPTQTPTTTPTRKF